MLDLIDQFRNAMLTAGITPPTQIHADGKKHRFSTNSHTKDTSGEYRIYPDGIPAGYFIDFRIGECHLWSLNMGRPYTLTENIELKEAIEKRAQQEQAEQDAAIHKAQGIWDTSPAANPNHPYLVAKGIKPIGLRTYKNSLLIPVTLNKKIYSLQFIKPDGQKFFMSNGRVHGCYFGIGKPTPIICICEGVATGFSIYQATGHAVVVAFNCGNLLAVSQHIRDKNPQSLILICSDDDATGLKFAKQAAELGNGKLSIPLFDKDRPEKATDFNDMATLYGLDQVKDLINAACVIESSPALKITPRPLLNSLPAVMPFDSLMLPKVISDFVIDISNRQKSPPDFIAVTAICGLSSVLGSQILMRPKQNDDWTVTANLWGAIIGRPSAMKSPTMKAALQPLYMLESQFFIEYTSEKQKNQKELILDGLTQKINKKKAEKNLEADDRDKALLDLENNPFSIAPLIRKRLIVNDATVEKLGELLNENPNGLILVRDELSGWLSEIQKEENQSDRAFYLECFDDNSKYTCDRIGRGTIEISNCTLSIIGGIQPTRIAPLIHQAMSGQTDDGLIQRLQLAVWPDDVKEWTYIDEAPDSEAYRHYEQIFHDFYNIQKRDSCTTKFMRFTSEAQDLFVDWTKEIQEIARSEEIHPVLESHFLKMPQTIASLALIFELINGGRQAVGKEATIMALRWAYYLKSHAERLYNLGINKGVDGANIILPFYSKRVKKQSLEVFNFNGISS